MTHANLRTKLEGIGFGLFIPVFFVTSAAFASTSRPCSTIASNLAMVPIFLVALLAVRGLPAIPYRGFVGQRRAAIAGVLQATSLPFIVAATAIGQELGPDGRRRGLGADRRGSAVGADLPDQADMLEWAGGVGCRPRASRTARSPRLRWRCRGGTVRTRRCWPTPENRSRPVLAATKLQAPPRRAGVSRERLVEALVSAGASESWSSSARRPAPARRRSCPTGTPPVARRARSAGCRSTPATTTPSASSTARSRPSARRRPASARTRCGALTGPASLADVVLPSLINEPRRGARARRAGPRRLSPDHQRAHPRAWSGC